MTEEKAEQEFDREAEPVDLRDVDDETAQQLRETLWSLNQIDASRALLDEQRQTAIAKALPLFKALGRPVMITNPATGRVVLAAPREDEILVVPAGKLLDELRKHFAHEGYAPVEAEEKAELIWSGVLKPPAVDTKEGGLFKKAVDAGDIPGYVVARVATFSKKAAFIGFSPAKP